MNVRNFSVKVFNKDAMKVQKQVIELEKPGRYSFCRCWESEKFPFCDGRHRGHNEQNCDNLGPIVVVIPEKSDTEKKNETKT